MSDRPRRDGSEPPPQQPYGNQGATDPAYAYPPPLFGGQDHLPTQHAGSGRSREFHEAPTHPPTYQSPADANPTQQLPSNWQQGGGYEQQGQYGSQPNYSQPNYYGAPPPQYGGPPQYGQPWTGGAPPEPPEPDGPGSRMWLWALAGVAVLLVIGLVVAVFIVSSSSDQTVVAPPLEPSATATTTTPRTTTSRAPAPAPSDTSTSPTSESATPGVTEEVVYTVGGDGKALNITYIDDGGVLQTEFNVSLPWTKTVKLDQPAKDTASVSVVKLGGEVSCSISVAGTQITQKSGRGLTLCKGPS